MNIIDIVILITSILILVLIFYFHIYKNWKSPCKGCLYAKDCNTKSLCNKTFENRDKVK